MPTHRGIVKHVENRVQYLFNGLSSECSLEFVGLITRCQELFRIHTHSTKLSYYARKEMPVEQAMRVIQNDLMPLLADAETIRPANASQEYRVELHKLLEYIDKEVIKSPLIGTPKEQDTHTHIAPDAAASSATPVTTPATGLHHFLQKLRALSEY